MFVTQLFSMTTVSSKREVDNIIVLSGDDILAYYRDIWE